MEFPVPASEIRWKIYSAVLDAESCPECASWDGVHLEPDDPRVEIPNALCTCAGGCRCCWIFTMMSESIPVVGPQKKPPR